MKSEILEEIKSAFGGVNPPAFENFLDSIMYFRADDEPVEFAREIYPCSDIGQIDRYKLNEILLFLTVEAYLYVLPRIFIYLIEVEDGVFEDFTECLLPVLDISPKDSDLPEKGFQKKGKEFYSRLTTPQRKAIITAFTYFVDRSDIDARDAAIYQYAVNMLKKMET